MNGREMILDILMELAKTDGYANRLLTDVLEKYDYLEPKEKAFIKRVVEGTIEQKLRIDYVLNGISNVPVNKMKPLIRELLRMSAYQILFMDSVPDSAVCNEAVKLAKKRKFASLQGYVNGVLRNLSRQKGNLCYPDPETDYKNYLSVMYSMPLWLTEHFLQSYGQDVTQSILQAFLQRGPVTLRLEEGMAREKREKLIAGWEKKGVVVKQHPYLSYALQVEKSEGIKNLDGYREGLFSVQDVSSMLVIEAAGIRPGQTVIDLCASPGGKSLHAATKLEGTGKVLSFDLTEAKTARIEENRLRMQKENVMAAVNDARSYTESLSGLADVVIADVPCSGLGVIGKKQDIKYHATRQSLQDITALQREILQNAAAYVKEDGILMYSTCTMNPEENEKMVEWFCNACHFCPEDMSGDLPEALKEEGKKGMLQLFPGIHETDGFFFARLRKCGQKCRQESETGAEREFQANTKQESETGAERQLEAARDIKSFTPEQLREQMAALSEKPYRAAQLYEWMHVKLARDYDSMTNLPKAFREKCRERFFYTSLKPVRVQESKTDGTKKFLFALSDGNLVESVWMRYKHGNSVCISSQVGCRMGCRFCASTLDGLERNLLPSEMLDQVYAITGLTGERVSNVVVMGCGEPLDNYDNLLRFLRLLTDENGLHISQRNITVSTCGIVPGMYRLAGEKLQITLALSLHAASDEKRRELMPIANRYSLDELMKACTYYFEKTGRRITFEYSLIGGVNDSAADADRLAALVGPLNCHVNLIPVNPVKERDFAQSDRSVAVNFKKELAKYGINVTIRREMGRDIDGACGQLRHSHIAKRS